MFYEPKKAVTHGNLGENNRRYVGSCSESGYLGSGLVGQIVNHCCHKVELVDHGGLIFDLICS